MYQCLLLLTEQFFKENVPLSRHQCQMRAKLVKTIHCAFVVKYSSYKWMSKLKMCHVQKKEYTYILCTYSSSAIALAEERNAATTILHDSKNCSPFCCRFFFREKNRGEKTTRWQIKSEAWKRSITWSWARLYFSSYFWIRNLKGWKEVMYCNSMYSTK